MVFRELTAAFAGAVALVAATGGLAAPSTSGAAADAKTSAAFVATYPIYDRVTDPMTAAIRAILREAGAGGALLDKREASAVAEYYKEQGYAPSWTRDGTLTERAKRIIARLNRADIDGLDPRAYRTPPMGMGTRARATVAALAAADVRLSQAIVTYARDAHSGRYDPADISRNFDYERHWPDTVAVLQRLASAADPVAALASYNPTHIEFVRLRDKLAEIRASTVERPPVVPAGRNLKLGSSDERVVILRQRLKVTAETKDPKLFDAVIDEAVKAFQESVDLRADGIVGPATLGALNAGAEDHVATIIANMERWRWMPEDLGRFYVRVNVPRFNVEIYRDGKVVHTTRVVLGRPSWQTPIFSDEIEHVIVNPRWNVPASIAREMLPDIRANPAVLRGYNVYANIGGRFQPVDPLMVDWNNVDMRKIQIKQPPGARNALGRIKFMLPNRHAIYLHDTPAKHLFERDYRAYSHGCVRVKNPWEFAEALLAQDPELSAAKLKKLVGGRETQVNLTRSIPVHITYFTAWVDDDGTLQVRDDLYGHDARMQTGAGLQS